MTDITKNIRNVEKQSFASGGYGRIFKADFVEEGCEAKSRKVSSLEVCCVLARLLILIISSAGRH